jgi:tetratricopeptide (TPR) repeat protein
VSVESAYAHLRAGRLAQAEDELRRVLDVRPGPEALELLGVLLGQQGRANEALAAFDRAIALKPSPGARHNRAQALFALGRISEARTELEAVVASQPDLHPAWHLLGSVLAAQGDARAEQAYRRALALRPDHAETHYNLGVFFLERSRLDEAIACYRKALALDAGFVAAHNNLANALLSRGRGDEALAHYAQAVRLEPGFAQGWSNYGGALRQAGRIDEAIAALERAVALAAHSWNAASELGMAYLARNRIVDAVACQRRALELKPDSAEVLTQLGNALCALGEWDEAQACYHQALQHGPENADAHNSMGMLRFEQGDFARAAASFRRALSLKPGLSEATTNLAMLLEEEGRTGEAIEVYRQAMQADPRNARAAYNLGIALLGRFEFAEGWEHCERRFDTVPAVTPRRAFGVPRLEERGIAATRRVAVWREQGVGDQVLYSTLLPALAAKGAGLVVEVDRRLVPAYVRAHPGWEVVPPEESARAFERCDAHVPIASLGRLLRPAIERFEEQPASILAPDPARVAQFGRRLASAGSGRPIVGVSWRSFQPGARRQLGRRKSSPLRALHELSQHARLVDLQYGDTADERAQFAASGGRLERLEGLDALDDLDGLLAAIAACDLVVTTSNVTAHLAGALGKRTLLVFLSARPPFHYWASPQGRSLWYPCVEIVTAPALDTWERAFGRVHELLRG